MEGSTKIDVTALLHKLVLISFTLVVIVYYDHLVDARAVPRSSSRSFRFPSSSDEHPILKDSGALLSLAKGIHDNSNQYYNQKNQGRNAIITLENNPIKAAVPESPENPFNKETSLQGAISTEIIDGDLDIQDDDHGKKVYEDEALRETLCPSKDDFISSSNNNSTNFISRGSETVISSSSDSRKLRYDLQAGKCAEIGERGHCGENMVYVSDNESAAYGYCECDFENKILRKETKQAALLSKTPLVYHPATNACHRLYEQAYCNEGEWLVLSREEKGPLCERNQCSTQYNKSKPEVSGFPVPSHRRRASKLLTPEMWTNVSVQTLTKEKSITGNTGNVSFGGSGKHNSILVPLNGSGPCVKLFEANSEHCEVDEQVVFNVGDIVPKCGFVGRGIEGRAIIRNACPPGSYYSIIGRCQPDWDF